MTLSETQLENPTAYLSHFLLSKMMAVTYNEHTRSEIQRHISAGKLGRAKASASTSTTTAECPTKVIWRTPTTVATTKPATTACFFEENEEFFGRRGVFRRQRKTLPRPYGYFFHPPCFLPDISGIDMKCSTLHCTFNGVSRFSTYLV